MRKINSKNFDQLAFKAEVLVDSLDFIALFKEETLVIFIDGNILEQTEILATLAKNIVMIKKLGINLVIVHGVSERLDKFIERQGLKLNKVEHFPIYDYETIEVVEMFVSGHLNKMLVQAINNAGGSAIGISGKDSSLIEAKKIRHRIKTEANIERIIDHGYYGEAVCLNPDLLVTCDEAELIPIIAPIGITESGETIFTEPYKTASLISTSLAAGRLVYITQFDGIFSKEGALIHELSLADAKKMLKHKTIPYELKLILESSIEAIDMHTESAHIISGKFGNSILLELFTTDRIGTMICAD